MHDSLECRIRWCLSPCNVHKVGPFSVGGSQLLEPYWWDSAMDFRRSHLAENNWLQTAHEAAGSASLLTEAAPFNVLQWIQIYVDLSCCAPFMHFIYRCVKNRESWSPTCFKKYQKSKPFVFLCFIENRGLKRVSGFLIPLG